MQKGKLVLDEGLPMLQSGSYFISLGFGAIPLESITGYFNFSPVILVLNRARISGRSIYQVIDESLCFALTAENTV